MVRLVGKQRLRRSKSEPTQAQLIIDPTRLLVLSGCVNPSLPTSSPRKTTAAPDPQRHRLTTQPRESSRASYPFGVSLCVVFAVCKLVVVLLCVSDGNHALFRFSSVPALLSDDALAVLLWLLIDAVLVSVFPRIMRPLRFALFVAAAIYVASNVPVMRMFGTPLTYPILHAADVALADSLKVYVTPGNVLGITAVIVAALVSGVLFHRMLPRPSMRASWSFLLFLVGMWGIGSAVRSQISPFGLTRNPLLAIAHTTLLQRSASGESSSIRVPPLPAVAALQRATTEPDLSSLTGIAKDRDVLWIVLESTASQYLRPYGSDVDPMPNLTALAKQSLVMESIYAAYPESIKGLFSALCSMNPAAHTTAARYTQTRIPCPGIAAQFASAGYHTAMFHSGWFVYLGMKGIVEQRGFSVLEDAGNIGGQYATSFGVDEESTVKRVLHHFDSLPKGERGFVMYLPITGHHPYHSPGPRNRPQPFPADSDLNAYRNDLFLGDLALGALLQGLSSRGRMSNLLIVISGDHGEAFLQHEGNFGHTLHLYDENLRVPLVIHIPGITDRTGSPFAQTIFQPGSIMDIAPTILGLSGLPIPSEYQGRSLLAPRDGTHAARFLTDHALEELGLRHGQWKFILEPSSGRTQLYDLSRDRGEKQNLAELHKDLVSQYRAHLFAWFYRQRVLVTAR